MTNDFLLRNDEYQIQARLGDIPHGMMLTT